MLPKLAMKRKRGKGSNRPPAPSWLPPPSRGCWRACATAGARRGAAPAAPASFAAARFRPARSGSGGPCAPLPCVASLAAARGVPPGCLAGGGVGGGQRPRHAEIAGTPAAAWSGQIAWTEPPGGGSRRVLGGRRLRGAGPHLVGAFAGAGAGVVWARTRALCAAARRARGFGDGGGARAAAARGSRCRGGDRVVARAVRADARHACAPPPCAAATRGGCAAAASAGRAAARRQGGAAAPRG